MISELEVLIENWKAVVDDPNLANAFLYKNPDSKNPPLRAISYTIKSSQVKKLLKMKYLTNIRITMGCSTKTLTTDIDGTTPIFTPIISGIGRDGAERHYEMRFYPGDDKINGIAPITLEVAANYVENWLQHLNLKNMAGAFKVQKKGAFEKLEYYTFDDEDIKLIKDLCKGRRDVSIFLHLGLEPFPTEKSPFKFRTVLEVSKGTLGKKDEERTFYQLSSPCPHHCGGIIRRNVIDAS